MTKPRYDAEKNESRHAAVDEAACRKMARLNQWELVEIDVTGDATLEADCVFKGKTEFPKITKED